MFSVKEKENESGQQFSPLQQAMLNNSKQKARVEKERRMSNLRQLCHSQIIDWNQPLHVFQSAIQSNRNQYSWLVTMFELAEDPLWRNKASHLCSLIQLLHNQCAEQQGVFLGEVTRIQDYHARLCHIFYLADNQLQEHFKLFIMIVLSYNQRFLILDEADIALGLLHAGRTRTDNQLPEYLWLVSQLRVDQRSVSKLLKYGQEILAQAGPGSPLANEALIPIVSTLANYLCYEQDAFVLEHLLDNDYFQGILMHSLNQQLNPDLNQ
jgi:hypothetical protein